MVNASTKRTTRLCYQQGKMNRSGNIEYCSLELGWAKENSEFPIIWEGEGINEIGKRPDTGQVVIKIDPRYFRPTEVDQL